MFRSEDLTVMMKASLFSVIQVSLTFPHGTDQARMNKEGEDYKIS